MIKDLITNNKNTIYKFIFVFKMTKCSLFIPKLHFDMVGFDFILFVCLFINLNLLEIQQK